MHIYTENKSAGGGGAGGLFDDEDDDADDIFGASASKPKSGKH